MSAIMQETAPEVQPMHVKPTAPRWHRMLLALVVAVSALATLFAMRTTSTTFDEIVLIAGGARGLATGEFDLAPDHPPLMQYVYGLPVFLSKPAYPDESRVPPDVMRHMGYRYNYAQNFFWKAGNDAERLAFLGRLPAVLVVVLLVLATYAFTTRIAGPSAALLAATMVAFLPDVLAHGGVAYTDLPLALAFLVGLWGVDRAVRDARFTSAALAGLLVGVALGVKISAAALAPAAVVLIAMEAVRRKGEAEWRRRAAPAALVALAAAYLALVLVFRGDFLLEEFRYGLGFRYRHLSGGHGANAYLLGDTSRTGWWYFFPVAFLFKTSAGLHALMLIGFGALAAAAARAPREVLDSRLRAPAVGAIVFAAALLTSSLNIGFRYALPVLPLLCILTAAGVARFWPRATRAVRYAIVAAVAWLVVFPLSYYPNFLTFISEYGPGRDSNYRVLIDSSTDWGQGLLALRDFMHEQQIARVYLSYFGSGLPAGYGIEYQPLPSFFQLPKQAAAETAAEPEWVVISATNLAGAYLQDDPFAVFRNLAPDHVIANSLYAYRLRPGAVQGNAGAPGRGASW